LSISYLSPGETPLGFPASSYGPSLPLPTEKHRLPTGNCRGGRKQPTGLGAQKWYGTTLKPPSPWPDLAGKRPSCPVPLWEAVPKIRWGPIRAARRGCAENPLRLVRADPGLEPDDLGKPPVLV